MSSAREQQKKDEIKVFLIATPIMTPYAWPLIFYINVTHEAQRYLAVFLGMAAIYFLTYKFVTKRRKL